MNNDKYTDQDAEIELVFKHCEFFGQKIEEGLYRIKPIYAGSEFMHMVNKNNISYIYREGYYYLTMFDGPE